MSTPQIPNKRYFTIGEVSDLCEVKPHVLRYWEQEFPQLKPIKRRGNRRYYQHRDVQIIAKIYHLLYNKGYTISGARKELIREGSSIASIASISPVAPLYPTAVYQPIESTSHESVYGHVSSEVLASQTSMLNSVDSMDVRVSSHAFSSELAKEQFATAIKELEAAKVLLSPA